MLNPRNNPMRYVIPSQDKIFPFSCKHGTNDADCTMENTIGTKGKHSIAFNIFLLTFLGFKEILCREMLVLRKKKLLTEFFAVPNDMRRIFKKSVLRAKKDYHHIRV